MKFFLNKFFYIITVILLFFLINQRVLAKYLDVEGWALMESKEETVLWQKKDKEFTSEVLVNLSVPLGGEILRGYTIKNNDKKNISDYLSNTYPFAIWKVFYNGFDSSGNIYLKVIKEKDKITPVDSSKIIEEISKVSSSTSEGEHIIEKRLELFSSFFDDYLEKEGSDITVDPMKIIVIASINDIPPFYIETNDKHSVINITVISLD